MGYDVPIDHPDEIEVASIAPHHAPRAKGVKGRKVADHLVSTRRHEGLVLSSPATTWAMLGREFDERQLIVLGDAFVRIPRDVSGKACPQDALATPAQLGAAIDAGPRRGTGDRLRHALERIRVGSASPLETEFRLDAEDGGLPTPELDMEICDANGRLLGISEFVYPEYQLVVEIEGDHHRVLRKQWVRDIDKYRNYAEAGIEVVRLTSIHTRGFNPPAVGIVRTALIRRGWIE